MQCLNQTIVQSIHDICTSFQRSTTGPRIDKQRLADVVASKLATSSNFVADCASEFWTIQHVRKKVLKYSYHFKHTWYVFILACSVFLCGILRKICKALFIENRIYIFGGSSILCWYIFLWFFSEKDTYYQQSHHDTYLQRDRIQRKTKGNKGNISNL